MRVEPRRRTERIVNEEKDAGSRPQIYTLEEECAKVRISSPEAD